MSTSSFSYLDDVTSTLPDAADMRFGIILTEWNNHYTERLLEGTIDELTRQGVKEHHITVHRVPGAFELTYAAAQLAKHGHVNSIIVLGTVIRGDTPHFDYICKGVTEGITRLNTIGEIPIIFGVLTVNNAEQAEERCGGRLGNKGNEFALTAIKMVDYAWKLQK